MLTKIKPFGFNRNRREFRRFGDNPIVLTYKGEEGNEYRNEYAHQVVWNERDAHIITSKSVLGDLHYPVLDLDCAHQYYPSSTEGHGHLYIDVGIGWEAYKEVMEVLAKYGIIQMGYYKASVARGYSAVRLPWVFKRESNKFDVFNSADKWVTNIQELLNEEATIKDF